ncbi:hypothetical protein ABIE41_003876 [Bosea sp. OAE506]|uniref:hypothetical protein n=1 Tax=Bosea sp. OAE506 TaxID=2663870 RepID=UPI00178AECF8
MKRPFRREIAGRWRRSAARGMALAGFAPLTIAVVLRLPLTVCREIHACRHAPAGLWSAAEKALFREVGR